MLRMKQDASKPPNKPARRKVDWDAVERDYRTGGFTLRELEAKHGSTNSTIGRKAEREGWTKDLTDAIRQATNAQLVQQAVQQKCSSSLQNAAETVLVAASVNTSVILGHRKGLAETTAVRNLLLHQVAQAAQHLPDLAEVIEMLRKPDDNGIDRANDMMRKAMSRTALVDDLKKLAEVDERVRKGEREAFGIVSGTDDDPQAIKPKRLTIEFVDVQPR
jgi:RNA polymerase-binding transcription factor DksA